MGVGLQGQRSCISQAQTFLRPLERGERGGAAAAPAGRELPQEARAARSWREAKIVLSRVLAEYGKTKYVSLILLIYHICVSFPLFHFSLSQSAYTWWFGSGEAFPDGVQGQRPCISQAQTFLRPLERGERGGAAAAPAGRELPQEARAARSWREAKVGVNAMR